MFDPMQFQFSPQAEPFVQDPYGPAPQQYMLGTLSPQEQQKTQEQNALVDALRAMGETAAAGRTGSGRSCDLRWRTG